METPAIYERLTSILRDVFGDETIVAEPELTASRIKGWDSLQNLRVVLTIERAFNLRFTAAEISNLHNIGEFAALIQARTDIFVRSPAAQV
jgi:acyl carrier protein